MNEQIWERNIYGMVAYAHLNTDEKRQQVEEAITKLIQEHLVHYRQAVEIEPVDETEKRQPPAQAKGH